jgi:hypothetical protein
VAEGRRVLLVLGEDSVEDFWASSAAEMIEEACPGRIQVLATAERGGPPGDEPDKQAAQPHLANWLRRRLPVLPAFLLLGEDSRVAEAHLAPFSPQSLAQRAVRFLRGGDSPDSAIAVTLADPFTPFLPEVLDGPRAIEEAAADPAVAAFIRRFAKRRISRSALLTYEEGQGYYWAVKFQAADCGCSSSSAPVMARVILRPLDGAILARDFLAASTLRSEPPGRPRPLSPTPPDSDADLDGRE